MDDFSTPGTPNAFGLWPSPCEYLTIFRYFYLIIDASRITVNYPEPGKRPLSSTVPTIIEHTDGSFYLAIGGSGGSKIFPAVFQVILNLDWGYDASQAIEYGRLHDQLFPSHVEADDIYPGELLADLERRGHNITSASLSYVTVILRLKAIVLWNSSQR